MFIPKISEFTIRRYANAKSFQRGEAYYEAGAVLPSPNVVISFTQKLRAVKLNPIVSA